MYLWVLACPHSTIPPFPVCPRRYVLMCLVITGLQSYEAIDIYAPFATAFKAVGMQWASYIVAVGAIMGLITSLTGALIGQSRIYIILGRRQLLSPSLVRDNRWPLHPSPGNAYRRVYLGTGAGRGITLSEARDAKPYTPRVLEGVGRRQGFTICVDGWMLAQQNFRAANISPIQTTVDP
eukprot:350783-Chlamydomonas_euryale.AAC.3